jgi:hypothetical protein
VPARFAFRPQLFFVACAAVAALLLAPPGAGAATVANGDFETGILDGWQVVNEPSEPMPSGSWYAYSGSTVPGEGGTVPPPPSGTYAAITNQSGPGTHILYQDVALEPYYSHQLSLVAYYRIPEFGTAPTIPDPNSLHTTEFGPVNQQYRIDVIKPTADLYSLEPSDILAAVFATKSGDPKELGPNTYTADLSAFAGQTVRLRYAEVDNAGNFFAGTDSVAIASIPPSNAIILGKPVFNRKKGTAKLPVTVPGPGTLTIVDVKLTGKRIKGKTVQVAAAGTVNLPVKPTRPARNALLKRSKQKLKVAVSFTPTGGFIASTTRKLTLKLTPKK